MSHGGLPDLQFDWSKAKPQQEPWQQEFLSHAPEYASEFAGTVFLVFSVVTAVAVMFAPASPVLRFIPSTRMRLFVTGSILGAAGGLIAITPLGRISGAHLNPAISLGFFARARCSCWIYSATSLPSLGAVLWVHGREKSLPAALGDPYTRQ